MTTVAEDFQSWDAAQVAKYLTESADLAAYSEVIINNKITGKQIAHLSESDMKQMIPMIGDRIRFQTAIQKLQAKQRQDRREEVLWTGEEVLYFTCCDKCFQTCCGICPQDPSTYALSNAQLTIKTEHPMRCGPFKCCCGHEFDVDNVDVTHITSTDYRGVSPGCCKTVLCCGKPMEVVTIKTSSEGTKILTLLKGEGEIASKKIINQTEEAQVMERD